MKLNTKAKLVRLAFYMNGEKQKGLYHLPGYGDRAGCNNSLYCNPDFDTKLEEKPIKGIKQENVCPQCLRTLLPLLVKEASNEQSK